MSNELVEVKENPLEVYQALVASGTDPDKLAKLLDLQERWERGEAEKAFAAAMKACKEELPVVVRDAINPETKKKYASLENISDRINPVITRHGFTLSFGSKPSDKANHTLVTCRCRHELGHYEDFELECPFDMTGPKGGQNKTAIQGMGSAISYGRRYLKLMIFDLTVADEDDDGNAPHEVITAAEARALEQLLMDTNSDFAKFYNVYQIERLADLPKSQYTQAMAQVRRKLKT